MSAALPMTTTVLAVPKRKRDDYAFLPAALEITETPLSPIRSSMTLTICALVAAAIGICSIGRIDVIAIAQGKIQPRGRTKTVEPLEPGRVLRMAVANGQLVKAGDLLIELDPSESRAEEDALTSGLTALKAEALRRRVALLAAADGKALSEATLVWTAGTPELVRSREARVLESDFAQLAGQVASLEARADQSAAEAERLRGTIAVQETLAATVKQRLDMRSELLASGAESKAAVIDAAEAYQSQLATLATEKGQLGESEAARKTAEREVQQVRRTFRADYAQKLAEVERRIAEDEQRLIKARIRTGHAELRSPADGRVEGLTVTSPGQVLSSGEQVMQIVPASTGLEIEAYLPNSDAGFVHAGQTAIVKVEAYPFADYGAAEARVATVAGDAIPLPLAEQQEGNPVVSTRMLSYGGAQRVQNLVFPITLTLDKPLLETKAGDRALSSGMAVTVEVRTGSRRIISYLLSPLVEVLTTALRER